jgi:hypothetical protein
MISTGFTASVYGVRRCASRGTGATKMRVHGRASSATAGKHLVRGRGRMVVCMVCVMQCVWRVWCGVCGMWVCGVYGVLHAPWLRLRLLHPSPLPCSPHSPCLHGQLAPWSVRPSPCPSLLVPPHHGTPAIRGYPRQHDLRLLWDDRKRLTT